MKNYNLFKNNGDICSLKIKGVTFFHITTNGFYSRLKKILLILFFFLFIGSISGQDLPSSDPPDLPQRGANGNENAAPIGDGTLYLIGFGLAYITVKIIQANKKGILNEDKKANQ